VTAATGTGLQVNRLPRVHHRRVEVDGVEIAYREAGPESGPTLLLLHGFPSSSQQFRRLIDALGVSCHVVAPDYPGFGASGAPAPASQGGPFTYTFENLAAVMESFCRRLRLDDFFLYVFDFGAPVGFRIAARHPEWVRGMVVQNANAYDEGLSDSARDFIALRRDDPGAVETVHGLLTLSATRDQYESGAEDVSLVAPDGWRLDQAYLDVEGRKDIQLDLAFDYHSNLALYPEWQTWLREHRPPTLVVWGGNDPFFTTQGARAYERDVPTAEVHVFESGHFALEERLPEITDLVAAFISEHIS